MNLIVFSDTDIVSDGVIRLSDRRHQHIFSVHKATIGDTLKVGKLNGKMGYGKVLNINSTEVLLSISLETAPPQELPLTLILALPRPKMMRRIIQNISMLGVKDLYLMHSYRVDKSYWSTPFLNDDQLTDQLLLGLEQSVDTIMPAVHLRKRFKPFVEDELPTLCSGQRALVAHPYDASPCPASALEPTILAIGPEGGFIPYEITKLKEAGMESIHIGQRILKVETAVPSLISRLFPAI